jgi:phage terminase large subunit-like protein
MPGDTAGNICTHPRNQHRLFIRIDGTLYLASRLAFLYMKGRMPAMAEHKDRDMLNNRWRNLRPANRNQNGGNQICIGVRKRENGRFEARLNRKGLGTFDTFEQAAAIYQKAHAQHFGRFSPYR